MKQITECVRKTCLSLGLNENYFRILRKPARSIIVNLPIRRDDGSLKVMKGHWVLHSNVMGPGKGGFRIDSNTSLEQLQLLAQLMTWKCAVVGLPLGGFKGNVQFNAKELSHSEKERVVRAYTRSLINVLGPKTAIPSPDLNTNASLMAVMMDTYSVSVGATTPGVCTGKPLEVGGIVGRNRSVGWGLAHLIKDYLKRDNTEMKDREVVIQGIGHVGKNIALSAVEYGAKVISISDSSTGLYDPDGLDINDILQYKNENGSLKGYERADEIENDKMLCLECDALVPCATQNQINKHIADDIKAELIIEGANSPTTIEGDQILNERGISIIPDVIANSGGLIVSYFEWVQDLQSLQWSMKQVSNELDKIIIRAFGKVYDLKHKNHITYREAAYQIAVKRVVSALKYRGIYP